MAKFEVDIPTGHIKRVADAARLILGNPKLTDDEAVKGLIRQSLRRMVSDVEGSAAAAKAEEAAVKSASEIPIT